MSKNTYCIYKHTNKINGKVYIGQTCQKPEHRWGSEGQFYTERQPAIHAAIQKYGWDNFEHEILNEGLTQDEANRQEKYWVKYFSANDPLYGYNLTGGGDNRGEVSMETRKKLSDNRKKYLAEHPEVLKQMNEASLKATRKAVICLENGIIYESAQEAQRQTGLDFRNLSRCCHHEIYTVSNLHWEFYEEKYNDPKKCQLRIEEIEKLKKKTSGTNKKKVLCIETNEIFESATEAAHSKGISFGNICAVCRGDRKTTGGYHWKYITD